MSNVYRHGDSNTLYPLIFVIFGTFFDRENKTHRIYVISCKRLQRILNFKQIFFIFTIFTHKKPTTNPYTVYRISTPSSLNKLHLWGAQIILQKLKAIYLMNVKQLH